MKTLSIGIPVDGAIIVSRRRKVTDTAQTDLFGSYKGRWISDMAAFIRTFPRPVSMSTVRIEAGKRGMAAPLCKNWYGISMQVAGLRKIGYQQSPIKSRAGGTEAIWA